MNTRLRAAALALAAMLVLSAEGCPEQGPPAPSQGHDPNRAGEPDPAPHAPKPSDAISVRFVVISTIDTVVTYNAGHGNKFIDLMKAPGESWTVGAPAGAHVYISATPAHRDARGRGNVTVKAENAANGKLFCHDTNFNNVSAGADCHGIAK